MLPELTYAQFFLLSSLGLSVGIIGAIVGVGGGFLLVPALLFIFPDASPSAITSISLTAVFFNALSASIGYRIRGNQDFRTAMLLIMTAAPAAVLGAYVNQQTGRGSFEIIFGFALIFGAAYLLVRSLLENSSSKISLKGKTRNILQRDGRSYEYKVNEPMAAGVAPFAGFVAGFFGIGGGIINVPFMLIVLRIPANVAVATSQLELTVASAAALLVHISSGLDDPNQWTMAGVVGLGTLIGAQIGVRIAPKVGGRLVLSIIGLGLLIAGTRLLATSLF